MLRKSLILFIFLAVVLMPLVAEKLTKEKLLEMHKGGIDAGLIFQKIQRDGIEFEPTSDVLLELSKEGVPKAALSTILDGPSKLAPSAGGDTYTVATTFYKAGDYQKAVLAIQDHLKRNPTDARAKSLLILSLLKKRDGNSAKKEFAELQAWPKDTIAGYVTRLAEVLSRFDANESFQAAFSERLHEFDGKGAESLLEASPLSVTQRTTVRVWLEVYRGEFAKAREQLASLRDLPGGAQVAPKLKEEVDRSEKVFEASGCMISWLIYEPTCPEPKELKGTLAAALAKKHWEAPEAGTHPELWKNHLSQLLTTSPLSKRATDAYLIYTVTFGEYVDFEKLGRALLKANGVLDVPLHNIPDVFNFWTSKPWCHSRAMVLTGELQPFEAGTARTVYRKGSHLYFNATNDPAKRTFDKITPVKLTFSYSEALGEELGQKRKPGASDAPKACYLAGYFPTARLVRALGGEIAAARLTYNWQKFFLTIKGRPDLVATLPPPQVSNSGWAAALLQVAAVGATASAARQNNAALTQQAQTMTLVYSSLATQQLGREQDAAVGRQTWEQLLTAKAFAINESQIFGSAEDLLGALATP